MIAIDAAVMTFLKDIVTFLSLLECTEVESVRHRLIACIVGMDVVAGIELLFQPYGPLGISNRQVEVYDCVKVPIGANPTIHRLPDLFTAFDAVGTPSSGMICRAHHFDAVRVSAAMIWR
jgi:hypothetical protein